MLPANVQKHHRRSIRLKEYDYSQAGAYFITICAKDKKLLFQQYPDLKTIVQTQWSLLGQRYPEITLDAFVVMPNHLHLIIFLGGEHDDAVRRGNPLRLPRPLAGTTGAGASPAPTGMQPDATTTRTGNPLRLPPTHPGATGAGASPAPTVGDIIGAFKSICATEWLKFIRAQNPDVSGSIWQRNYYEHIVRSEPELNRIREYILNNPATWQFDSDNPERTVDTLFIQEWEWLETGKTIWKR